MAKSETADLVVIGAGMVGGWASWFAARSGADRVVVLEKDLAGQGASSRAAGIVRAQGGTPATVALGRFSIDFYRAQDELLGTDSGFRELGYLILAVTERDVREGNARVEMQRASGLDVRWVDAEEACRLNPTLATEGHRGGSFCATDGAIDPPRNVCAYSLAMRQAGVQLRERTPFLGLRTAAARGGHRRLTGVETPGGVIKTARAILTGGPSLRAVGALVGARIFAGGARHQVVVTEPHPAFEVERQPMVFDVGAGIYWRLEEGGLLWGMSNPKETPGPAREVDWPYLRRMQRRLNRLVPATQGLGIRKAWCGTIDYTPDHLPILGPVLTTDGTTIDGATVASPGGHGMMWGPAVARVAADLALEGRTGLIDVTDLGMDRFDEHGRSPFYDPIALPFPASADDD
ncbi:MAG: NAD(P)/FAD-dependent oxidoreductase [Actinomycetota bacterium]